MMVKDFLYAGQISSANLIYDMATVIVLILFVLLIFAKIHG